jgi:ubiquinone/menaquinone biosynthesis C-methylase UbiE
MPSPIKFNSKSIHDLAAYSGNPWHPASPYFAHAEPYMAPQWKNRVFPFIEGSDFSETLDLAAGHGRNSEYLLKYCNTLIIMDYQAANVAICKQRFREHTNITYITCNGFNLAPQPDSSITLIYCFDAMVHFDSDVVRSYLNDSFRVLKPGGRGFFHHSNYTGGHDWATNPGARNFMSKELFAHYAIKEGLNVVKQQVIDWGKDRRDQDCFTMIEKPGAAS